MRSGKRRLPGRAAWLVALLAAAIARADPSVPPERATAGGSLAWLGGEELELSGDMRVYLPLPLGNGRSLYLDLDARTNIDRVAGDFKFLVEDLDYDVELGFKRRATAATAPALRAFVGQRGTERVDADGQPWVRYSGLAVESPGWRTGAGGVRWHAAAGAVLERREVQADAIVRGGLEATSRSGPLSGFGVAIELDGLVEGGDLRADWRAGPHRRIPLGGAVELRAFAHWVESRDPLGLGADGLLAGLELRERDDGIAPDRGPPDVGGSLALGAGQGRLQGRFLVRVLSPGLGRYLRLVAEVDGNLLTAEDTGELYYLYHVGLEGSRGSWIGGTYFYHRSNHQLAEPNDTVTSINVLELGAETRGWDLPLRSRRRLEARLRAGYLIDSSFGERRRWHVRGGLRWSIPGAAWARLAPFAHVEGETGDVDRRLYALGVAPAESIEVRLEYRDDEQYFGRDRDALLLVTAVGF